MTSTKIQVKRFEFLLKDKQAYELPAHWIPFQVVEGQTHVTVWAYRNGNA